MTLDEPEEMKVKQQLTGDSPGKAFATGQGRTNRNSVKGEKWATEKSALSAHPDALENEETVGKKTVTHSADKGLVARHIRNSDDNADNQTGKQLTRSGPSQKRIARKPKNIRKGNRPQWTSGRHQREPWDTPSTH